MIKISVLEINVAAIRNNIKVIKSKLKQNTKFCLVAKANAYGFGAKQIAKNVSDLVDCFAVSSANEFYDLITETNKDILILQPVFGDVAKLFEKGAILTISDFKSLDKVLESAKTTNKICRVNVALNTGMNRFGFKRKIDFLNAIKNLQKVQNIYIFGVFSHFYDANNKIFAEKQKNLFFEYIEFADCFLPQNTLFHMCASEGIFLASNFNMVRVGMSAYSDKLHPTVSLRSTILGIQKMGYGETAGYSGIFVSKQKTTIAIVGIGYGDGLPRNIVQNGYVLINDYYAKIVAICMDSLFVDVTDLSAKIGDEVILIGKSKTKQIFICDVASCCDTIEYDIIIKITDRVKRVYR